ncbi:hypothetical protein BDB01DRAFT_840217 [Pilobolus umbonatus]|nr:hypothetical protein BDB01DRAFT_840217 [Pilobolus umbonatus]
MDNPPIILFEHLDYETNKIEFSSLVSSCSRHSGVRPEPSLFRVMLGRKEQLYFWTRQIVGVGFTSDLSLERPFSHVPIRANKRRFKPSVPTRKRSRAKVVQASNSGTLPPGS